MSQIATNNLYTNTRQRELDEWLRKNPKEFQKAQRISYAQGEKAFWEQYPIDQAASRQWNLEYDQADETKREAMRAEARQRHDQQRAALWQKQKERLLSQLILQKQQMQ